MPYKNYTYDQYIEKEDDNRKIFHTIITPDGKSEDVDLSPYEWMTKDGFEAFCDIHEETGVFPSRADIDSIGPLHEADVLALRAQFVK